MLRFMHLVNEALVSTVCFVTMVVTDLPLRSRFEVKTEFSLPPPKEKTSTYVVKWVKCYFVL